MFYVTNVNVHWDEDISGWLSPHWHEPVRNAALRNTSVCNGFIRGEAVFVNHPNIRKVADKMDATSVHHRAVEKAVKLAFAMDDGTIRGAL